jgi:fluoroacetyl-CoA thioesterase
MTDVTAQLIPGLEKEISMTVGYNDTAAKYGSGMVEVFATPAMIALMESCCMQCVAPYLPEGIGTVGTEVNVRHLKATPSGMRVICKARLDAVEGKQLTFFVEAFDEENLIGSGTHRRYIINSVDFMKKFAKQ